MKYSYCFGIRLDGNYNEVTCKIRESCPYFKDNRLSEFLSRPDTYQELDTYNNEKCKYYDKERQVRANDEDWSLWSE